MAEKAAGKVENAVCLYSLTRFNEAAIVKKKKQKHSLSIEISLIVAKLSPISYLVLPLCNSLFASWGKTHLIPRASPTCVPMRTQYKRS